MDPLNPLKHLPGSSPSPITPRDQLLNDLKKFDSEVDKGFLEMEKELKLIETPTIQKAVSPSNESVVTEGTTQVKSTSNEFANESVVTEGTTQVKSTSNEFANESVVTEGTTQVKSTSNEFAAEVIKGGSNVKKTNEGLAGTSAKSKIRNFLTGFWRGKQVKPDRDLDQPKNNGCIQAFFQAANTFFSRTPANRRSNKATNTKFKFAKREKFLINDDSSKYSILTNKTEKSDSSEPTSNEYEYRSDFSENEYIRETDKTENSDMNSSIEEQTESTSRTDQKAHTENDEINTDKPVEEKVQTHTKHFNLPILQKLSAKTISNEQDTETFIRNTTKLMNLFEGVSKTLDKLDEELISKIPITNADITQEWYNNKENLEKFKELSKYRENYKNELEVTVGIINRYEIPKHISKEMETKIDVFLGKKVEELEGLQKKTSKALNWP